MTLLASPQRSQPHSSNPRKYFKHMTDFCFYKALTIHQLIQFRTPALPYYADRHSLTILSGGLRLAALNALQDYTLHRKAKESPAAAVVILAVDYRPQPQLPACQESRRPCYHDNQVKIDLISALHLCTGSDRERTASSGPQRLSKNGPMDLKTLVSAQWVTTVQCSTCRN